MGMENVIIIGTGCAGWTAAIYAARAMLDTTELSARDIVEKGLGIAADICIYTNHNRTIESLVWDRD